MVDKITSKHPERLALCNSLSEISKIPVWIENLPVFRDAPDHVKSAVNLCLEEAVSNVIRHGYSATSDKMVEVQFSSPSQGHFVFVVVDEAPHFNPLEAPALPVVSAERTARVGGQGIRFLREFADQIEYEATPTGNRLRMFFSTDEGDST